MSEMLNNISNYHKVGIVGRTGAGKSSLASSIFRLLEPRCGGIYIDGILINEIGLHDLRRKLTIIPQDPLVFSGTVRDNLDPHHEYSDETIWSALRNASLYEFVRMLPRQLKYLIVEGGENLRYILYHPSLPDRSNSSLGQKQLFCLARALLRRSKILILDEATASVDVETDNFIQSTIRTEFKGSTVICIGHRINTIIDYDRIAVFDNRKLAEFDTPSALLAKKDSIFCSLVKEAYTKVQTDGTFSSIHEPVVK